MAYSLPNTQAPDVAFHNAIGQGGNLYNMVIQHAMQRAQERRAQEMQPLKMRQMEAAMQHAAAASGRNAQARQEAHQRYLNEQNPDYAANKFMHEMQMLGNMGGENRPAENAPEERPQQFNALREMMQSRGMPQGKGPMMNAPEEQEQPKMVGSPEQQPAGAEQPKSQGIDWNNLNPVQKMWAAKHGYKPAVEALHEKMEREIATSNIKEQGKLDVKRAQQLREAGKDLELAGVDVKGIHDILTGPDSLGTGITKTLIGKLGWGSEKLGAFNERALRLQTQMTKALSSRGGVGAAKIVQSGKPSTWKSTSENIGITDAYADRIKNEFDLLNQEYKGITGKDLPYTLPEYVHNIGKKIDTNKFTPKMNFDSEKEYHDYMSTLTPAQRKIVVTTIRGASK